MSISASSLAPTVAAGPMTGSTDDGPPETPTVAPAGRSTPAPSTDFDRRLAALAPDDHAGAVALAEAAIELRRFDEADTLYRRVLLDDPMDDAAYYGLLHLSSARPLSVESAPRTGTRALLGDGFVETETRHFVILSDADPRWTRTQADRLEAAYEQFMRYATYMELRALPLEHKLVALVFGDREDFITFARMHDAVGARAGGRVAGYYSPIADRLVFYHVESDANIAQARDELEQMYAEVAAVKRASRRVSSTGRRGEGRAMREGLDEKLRHLDERERRLNLIARQHSIAVTVHEAIHHLMFHTRVQSPYVQQPLWLTEGLATAFETDDPALGFGPTEEFDVRREKFWNMLDNGTLLPLRELIAVDSAEGVDARTVSALYNQGYALITWMSKHRKIELRNYLRRLNALPPGVPSAATQIAGFEESFGDIERLEKIWLEHED